MQYNKTDNNTQTALARTWQSTLLANCHRSDDLLRFFGAPRVEAYTADVRLVIESIFPSPKAIEAEMVRAGICQRGWAKLWFRGNLKAVAEVKGIPFNDSAMTAFADAFCNINGKGYKIAVFMLFFGWCKAGMGSTYGKQDVTQLGAIFANEFQKWFNNKRQQYSVEASNIQKDETSSNDTTMEEAERILGYEFKSLRAGGANVYNIPTKPIQRGNVFKGVFSLIERFK